MKERKLSLQLDEATENSRDAHLICYVRFADFSKQNLVEGLLFCKPIELGCRRIDLFNIIDFFFFKNDLDWKKCISIYTNGAKAISGSSFGLRSIIIIQERTARMATWTHFMIPREALVARELSPELDETVEIS